MSTELRDRPVSTLARRTLWRAAHPVNLAVVRITLCVTMFELAAEAIIRPRNYPTSGPTVPPDLLGRVLVELPRDSASLRLVAVGLAASCVFGAVGIGTRWAMTGVVVLGAYHLGVPQIFGKVDHNHHYLWIAAVLAFAPCGDALAWGRRRQRTPGAAIRYGFPLRVIWLLIGLAYFFPGYWKVRIVGLDWASASNMASLMWNEWTARGGYEPIVDITRHPTLLSAGGLLTMAFEIGFVFLVLWRRTRWMAVVGGVAFHVGVGLTIGIWFLTIVPFYVAFVDWTRPLGRLGGDVGSVPDEEERRVPSAPGVAVPSLLLATVMVAGVAQLIDGWPVAAYPDFASHYPDTVESVEVATEQGAVVTTEAVEGFSGIPRHRLLLRSWRSPGTRREVAEIASGSDACRSRPGQQLVLVRSLDPVVDGRLRADPDPAVLPLLSCPL